MNTTDQTNQQVPHQGATMTTEPITTGEVLSVTRAVHDVAQIMSVTLGSKSIRRSWRAASAGYRATADFLEAFGKAATPGILRREADRIDPPTVPAEPDLTTADGWYAEADAFGYDLRSTRAPVTEEQRAALVSAWAAASSQSAAYPWLAVAAASRCTCWGFGRERRRGGWPADVGPPRMARPDHRPPRHPQPASGTGRRTPDRTGPTRPATATAPVR
ncbi:MAG: hypothetical protein IPF65_13730 [Polaromonas sp.]|nr:hypothetical protein [Polaromonas sp.]